MLPPLPEPSTPPCPDCGYLACVCGPPSAPEPVDWAATEAGPPPTLDEGEAWVDWVERRAIELCRHGTHPVPCHLHVRQATLQADMVGWPS